MILNYVASIQLTNFADNDVSTFSYFNTLLLNNTTLYKDMMEGKRDLPPWLVKNISYLLVQVILAFLQCEEA